jgi:hypothetical protein
VKEIKDMSVRVPMPPAEDLAAVLDWTRNDVEALRAELAHVKVERDRLREVEDAVNDFVDGTDGAEMTHQLARAVGRLEGILVRLGSREG